ncbi:tubulointerstitial nephritis antigen-like [Adelges cooleyi]|uniref:tubulointerstitial nephritis antigen-like n=1 Tax=Adelges cooleyi TaxID=133065 RepID=UPI0021807891|nr:tubulointerstitial nephritis antigen-like [Adelges cooleyi]
MEKCWRQYCDQTALLAMVVLTLYINSAIGQSDLAGSYCASRPRGCCPGRQDECSAPIMGTTCYCDDFCNRTRSEDCCPDFWSFCKGIVPPEPPLETKQCYANGQYYKYGEAAAINCNECRCQEVQGELQLLCSRNECLVEPDLLGTIRAQANRFGWAAGNYTEFWGRKYEDGLNLRLGILHSKKKILQMRPLKAAFRRESLPRAFDVRSKWPNLIARPLDQGWCAASWVISTVQVSTDRFGIMTKGAINDVLSTQHLLSCNNRNQRGCQGGHLTRAWNWIRKFGLVTEACYPWEARMTECAVPKKKKEFTAPCPRSQRFNPAAKTQLHRMGPVYRVSTEEGIMNEIMTSGPVQAVMKVSRDFFIYKTGVYKCSSLASGSRTGYHAVRIVGWGEEYQGGKLVKYWIVSNSWGQWWGEEGYFRILKGTNECQIEDFVIAAWADINDFNITIPPQGYDIFLLNGAKANSI